jgi:regulator of sigma E protease
MEIFVFIVVLVVLIVVHELGHFIAAKLSGMRVDEFGLGYPPRAVTLAKVGETRYTLNWIPFGGFVKIYGEDALLRQGPEGQGGRAFIAKPRILQAFVLVAGIAMNLLFAYVLIAGALVAGTPRALSPDELATAHATQLAVADVLPGSPAARAGLVAGDLIIGAKDTVGQWKAADPESFSKFIAASEGDAVTLDVKREGKEQTISARPMAGVAKSDPTRYALGVEVATIGIIPLSPSTALKEGATLTWGVITLTAQGLWHFFYSALTLTADLSQVAGPVGIAGVVGAASLQGIGGFLSIVAIISINLALINLIPVPALDGGRLLFVIIESIIRRPIKPVVARSLNMAGFALLLLLMVVVTTHDIFKIVN